MAGMAKTTIPVGDNVKRLREAAEKSKSELCRESGISRSYWDEVEDGSKDPTVFTLERMASALGVTVHDLIAAPNGNGRKRSREPVGARKS
jgi:XRE family transcriptional regulator, regulator of sulfur utilization